VIEEGEPYLVEGARAACIAVEGKPESFRFGELNSARVRRILEGDNSPEPKRVSGKPPAFCPGCPHRSVYTALKNLDCIVQGDIGCYALGALPPFEAMDSMICMGASIGMGLGLRYSLPPEQAKRVVSIIGDSTFVHSGITGLVEMVLQPAGERPRGGDPGQRDHRHGRACRSIRGPGAPWPTRRRQGGLRGAGAHAGHTQCVCDRSHGGAGEVSADDTRLPGPAGALGGDLPPQLPAGKSLDPRVREVQ